MPTLDDAFRDVLARPVDDQPRLAYAALCDAAKDPRGAFIRSHIAVLSGGPPGATTVSPPPPLTVSVGMMLLLLPSLLPPRLQLHQQLHLHQYLPSR